MLLFSRKPDMVEKKSKFWKLSKIFIKNFEKCLENVNQGREIKTCIQFFFVKSVSFIKFD